MAYARKAWVENSTINKAAAYALTDSFGRHERDKTMKQTFLIESRSRSASLGHHYGDWNIEDRIDVFQMELLFILIIELRSNDVDQMFKNTFNEHCFLIHESSVLSP